MNSWMSWSGGFFEWIVQTTWQAAVLAALILAAQRLFAKRLSPDWRYGLWLLLVARLLMPASPPSSLSIFNLARIEPAATILPEPVVASQSRPGPAVEESLSEDVASWSEPLPFARVQEPVEVRNLPAVCESPSLSLFTRPVRNLDWHGVVVWVWLAGVLFFASRLVWTHLRFQARVRYHVPISDPEVLRVVEECRVALGLRKSVLLIETEEVETPSVCGFWRKRLLLPDGIFEAFSSSELRHVLLHELAHLKRRDLEVNWLVSLLQALHWFNPVLWFAFRRMRADRELATDSLALSCAAPSDHLRYGDTILKMLETLTGRPALPGVVGIVEDNQRMAERMRAIARHGTGSRWKWTALLLVLGLSVLALTDANPISQGTDANTAGQAMVSR